MLDHYAYRFVALMEFLRLVENIIDKETPPNATSPRPDQGSPLAAAITTAQMLTGELAMPSTQRQVERISQMMGWGLLLRDLLPEIRQLKVRVEEELQRANFLYVSDDLVAYWEKEDLFGLGKKFTGAHKDIQCAGNCLAVGQGTGCVLLLDRAMEIAIRRLATRLRVKINPKDTWGGILGKMDGAIQKLPERNQREKTKKDRWSEARTHLFHVKQVWRDRPMHGKESYSPARAREIFEAVRVFMVHLATL
jgi:hypothetical protein